MKTIVTTMACWLVSLASSVSPFVKGNRVSSNGILKALSLSLMAVLLIRMTACGDIPTAVTEALVPSSAGKASAAAPADAYVDDDAGGANDGTSWANAFSDLNDALANATDVDGDGAISIWIAEGTYVPSGVYSPDGVEGGAYGEEARSGAGIPLAQYEADRNAGFLNTFYLADGVRLFGGFRGPSGGGNANHRNTSTFRTTLSGDVLENDILDRADSGYRASRADNVWHVTSAGNDTPTLGGGAVLMDGITIENGDAVDALFDGVPGFVWTHREGGGLYAVNSDVSLNDVVVRRNESRGGGGIILRTHNPFTTSFVATYRTFHDNHAGDEEPGPGCCGGAIRLSDQPPRNSTGLIENSTFTENTAGGGGGGAVAAATRLVTVRNSHFEENSVGHAGGALQSRSADTNYIIEDNTFTNNFAGDRSGAVDKVFGEVELRRNVFLNNRSDANNGDGAGAVAIAGGEVDIIEDNHFEGNTSGGLGGAMGLQFPGATLKNNTYTANRSEVSGGAYFMNGAVVTSTGEIFEGNSALETGGAVAAVAFLAPQSASISGATFDGNFAEGINSLDFDALLASIGVTSPDPTHAGGAITNFLDATLTINNSNFENNYTVNGKGGAIANGGSLIAFVPNTVIGFLNGAALTVSNSVFNNNEARTDDGGAISSERIDVVGPFPNSPVTLSVNDVHLGKNNAGDDGGAISTINATLNLSKNHLSDNSAVANGGAVSADGGTITASNDHYNFNTAGENGGALYLRGVTGDLAQQHFNHNDADGLGDSMYLEGSPLDLSQIQIAGEDGDDIVIVPGISPMVARVSGPGAGVPAGESTEAPRMSLEELRIRWRFLLCDDDLRQLSQETGSLECSIDGPGQ